MKKFTFLIIGFMLLFGIFAFNVIKEPTFKRDKITSIPEYPQRTTGNAAEGWDYLRYGNYIGAGVPFQIFKRTIKKKTPKPNYLEREGKSADVPHMFNVFMENGVEVAGALNCFGCHGGFIDGQFIAGLGNNASDYIEQDNAKFFTNLEKFVKFRYGKNSGEHKAYIPLVRGAKYVSPYIETPFIGINPAFKLEEAAVAHRNPSDLTFADGKQTFPLTDEIYGSDVPPLWNVKKKNALYYNAMGRGDFTKLLMQVMVVAIEDSTEARSINDRFDDVLAWLNALEPPKFPYLTNPKLVDQGQAIFEDKCSKCHGFYSDNAEDEFYPNKFVGLDIVKTDTIYAVYAQQNKNFTNWLNSSWIMQTAPKAWVQPELGYIAPPLDGVWATAPYLHNGSVPTLEALLDSQSRPTFWRRPEGKTNYDYKKIGLRYTVEQNPIDQRTYNTTMKGYGNGGHTFGDDLTTDERTALLEYLKTL